MAADDDAKENPPVCGNCRYGMIDAGVAHPGTHIVCRRWPQTYPKGNGDWCGEYREPARSKA